MLSCTQSGKKLIPGIALRKQLQEITPTTLLAAVMTDGCIAVVHPAVHERDTCRANP